MRALEPVGTAGRHLELTLWMLVARDLRINRHSAEAEPNGRGNGSLVGVLGFHLDPADSRRSVARERTVRRSKALRIPRSAEPFTRLRAKRDLGLGNGRPSQDAFAAGPPDRQKPLE
jgi:hypothetical protein